MIAAIVWRRTIHDACTRSAPPCLRQVNTPAVPGPSPQSPTYPSSKARDRSYPAHRRCGALLRRVTESGIATVSTVTRIAAPGCPGQHRHLGELAEGSKQTENQRLQRYPPNCTTADGQPASPYLRRKRSAVNSLLEQKLWKWKLV